MKGTFQILSALAAVQAASATYVDWTQPFNGGRDKFTPPAYSSEKCTPKQVTGYDFADAPVGNLPKYDNFDFTGYKCQQSKLQRRNGRGTGTKCASSHVEPDRYGNEIKCDKKFSVDEFDVSLEKESTIEFTYGMPDGSSCKQVSKCGTGITPIKNTQCGGAKTVKCKIHKSSKNQKKCGFNVHHVKFRCDSNPSTSTTTTSSTTPAGCNGYNCPGVTTTTSSTTPAGCNGENCPGVTTTSTTTTTPECNGEDCPGYTPSTTTTTASTTAPECNGEDCPGATPSSTTPSVCNGEDCPGATPSSTTTPECNGENCPGDTPSTTTTTTTTAPECNGENCPGDTPSTTATTTTAPECNGENCPGDAPSTTTTTTSAPECNGENCPGATPTTTPGGACRYGGNCDADTTTTTTTSPAGADTTTSSSLACGYGGDCGASTTASDPADVDTTTTPAGVPTPGNPDTDSPTTVPSVCTDYTCTATDIPSNATTTAQYTPPVDTDVPAVTTTYAGPPVPVVTNCPPVLPQCMDTWTKITQCVNSGDIACLCPNTEYINNVAQCVEAWSGDDAEVGRALEYMQGLCADYIPGNPAIVTAVPSYVTLPPVTSGASTVVVSTTITVPYTAPPAGTETPGAVPVYSTQVIATTITVCPVKLVATDPAKPVLVPGTVTAPAYVPAPTVPATTPVDNYTPPVYVPSTLVTAIPTYVPPPVNVTTPNPPVATGSASSVKAFGSIALAGVISIVALILA
ncbi:hypothetical protein DRE_01153 [Drechslerella stenobrocha 248]|uniref:CFEM domain-containing protein n=1 Tax=Drechslerella stenobrocha 248 TaxID=1043628 RepID=W7HW81_9PEZI|nr:hypothetical protein DRE_01153 [Drechslerella stenobrocha 248]